MSKKFYIADTHFGHENVIKFDGRPFVDINDMNTTMRDNWNEVVDKDDVVYILGDFMWKFKDTDYKFVKSLNGRKRLIKGNHDKATHSSKFKRLFEQITDYEKVVDGDITVILCHYPIIAYDGSFRGRNVHLYGHVHTTDEGRMVESFKTLYRDGDHPMRMYNVGCMMPWMNYRPRTLQEILDYHEKSVDKSLI
jgi:calcineurin-like phosphoesterase family protein